MIGYGTIFMVILHYILYMYVMYIMPADGCHISTEYNLGRYHLVMVPDFNIQISAVDHVPVDPMYGWSWSSLYSLIRFPRTGRSLVDSRGYVIQHFLRLAEPSQFISELNQLWSRHIGAAHLGRPWCLHKRLRVAHCFFSLTLQLLFISVLI